MEGSVTETNIDEPVEARTLPPLDHGGDDWAAPIPQASRRAMLAAWVLLAVTIAALSFAVGARIGRDRAPAATGGLGVGGFSRGGANGIPAGLVPGAAAGGGGTGSPAPASSIASSGASETTVPSTTSRALGGLFPGLDDVPPAGIVLGTVTGVDGRTIAVAMADGESISLTVPDGLDVPAVGSVLEASPAP